MNYGFVIDNRKCIGCHACTVACKAEHDTPIGVNRTWVKYVEKGAFPNTSREFSVMRCNHCADAPCTTICPTTALYTRNDGIVDFDNRRCIGCKACIQACPYDAIHIDPDSGTAAKCNYCAHRVEVGLEPPCVNVCPTEAIISGDIEDATSKISNLLALHPVQVRKPEKGTTPNLYYINGDMDSLTPRSDESQSDYMWSNQAPEGVDLESWRVSSERHAQEQVSETNDRTQARKVYGGPQPHRGSWGKSVSAYLFTKSIAAGIGLIIAPMILLTQSFPAAIALPAWILALVFLALTNFFLVYKLERPERFIYVLTKPQWSSWLVRGAYIMLLYGLLLLFVLAYSLFPSLLKEPSVPVGLLMLLAFGTAVYSAFLFGQAKGRDLWQTPLLPLHLLVHAIVAGAGALILLSEFMTNLQVLIPILERTLAAGLAASILTLGAEFLSQHQTVNADKAVKLITVGPFRNRFWLIVFVLGHLFPAILLTFQFPAMAAMLALIGSAVFEDLFVEAGQAIPLA